jgi:hypothetical protein
LSAWPISLARAASAPGLDYLEWACAGERCYLPQARRMEYRRPASPRRAGPATLVGGDLVQLARAVAQFGRASGVELVLPWYFAPGGAGSQAPGAGSASAHLFDVARTLGVPAVADVDLTRSRSAARGSS